MHAPAFCLGCRQRSGLRCIRPDATPRKCRDRDEMDLRGPCRWCNEVPGRCGWTPRECATEAAAHAGEMRRG
jgi:hypothetical protein